MMEANLRQADVRIDMARLMDTTEIYGVLPSQQFGARGKKEPEQRLMMAVLRDALQCLEKHRFATNDRDRRIFRKAQRWFLINEAKWPYSFQCICDVLDLDSNAVRRHLGVTS